MADEGIFATTAEVQRKVGANASVTSNTEAYINQYMTEAESYINMITGVNFSDTFDILNVDVKGVLKRWAGALAAIDVLNYDPSTLPLREFETRIDVLFDEATKCESKLKDKKASDFISGA